MANIRKRGDSYQIRVSCGYDTDGNQVTKSMTWRPDPSMTEKQAEKEVQKQAMLFEERCLKGCTVTSIKFEELAEKWFEMLTDYTGAKFRFSVFMDQGSIDTWISPIGNVFHFPVRRFNNVDVADSHVLLILTYFFGVFSELALPRDYDFMYYTESVIKDICEHFRIPFFSKVELEVQTMKIDRLLLDDEDSTRFFIGNKLIRKNGFTPYTITEVGQLMDDRREIMLTSGKEIFIEDEEDLIRNYYIINGLPKFRFKT